MSKPKLTAKNYLAIAVLLLILIVCLYDAVDKLTTNDLYITKSNSGDVLIEPHQLNWAEKLPYGVWGAVIIGGFGYAIYSLVVKKVQSKNGEKNSK